jgi:hypothetical protein
MVRFPQGAAQIRVVIFELERDRLFINLASLKVEADAFFHDALDGAGLWLLRRVADYFGFAPPTSFDPSYIGIVVVDDRACTVVFDVGVGVIVDELGPLLVRGDKRVSTLDSVLILVPAFNPGSDDLRLPVGCR